MKNWDWEYGLSTDKGPYKQVNEDRCFLRLETNAHRQHCALAVIADGMGGCGAGDEASQLAVERLKDWWETHILDVAASPDRLEALDAHMQALAQEINKELWMYSSASGLTPGTTLSVLIVIDREFFIYHTGDSRIYLLWNRQQHSFRSWSLASTQNLLFENFDESAEASFSIIEQLTEDQSWVAEEVRQGRLARWQMNQHPQRNVLTACLGVDPAVHVYKKHGFVEEGDLFVLCSDGFYALFTDEEILRQVNQSIDDCSHLQAASDLLVQTACERGTSDNVSLMLLRSKEKTKKSSFLRRLLPFRSN